jgi:hypothetical protein
MVSVQHVIHIDNVVSNAAQQAVIFVLQESAEQDLLNFIATTAVRSTYLQHLEQYQVLLLVLTVALHTLD